MQKRAEPEGRRVDDEAIALFQDGGRVGFDEKVQSWNSSVTRQHLDRIREEIWPCSIFCLSSVPILKIAFTH